MDVAIFQTEDGMLSLPVSIDQETVWLNRNQLADLFNRDVKTVGKHINNALREELDGSEAVVANFATTAADGKQYQVEHYSLDVILSVGYRVKSKRGIEFRKWANKVLKDYILQGYAINKNRLDQLGNVIKVLKRATPFIESGPMLDFLDEYALALDWLDRYDRKTTEMPIGTQRPVSVLSYEDCAALIDKMKHAVDSELFGHEKDESLKGIIGAIYQSFGGAELYPTAEEKAAHLLYFTVKDHSFSDGNKRIGAAIFLYFLEKNDMLYVNGKKKINDQSLVALTLLIAVSLPAEKDVMIGLIMSFLIDRTTPTDKMWEERQ